MEPVQGLSRRQIIFGTAGIGGVLASLTGAKQALAAICGLTPAQTPGPFYPQNNPLTDQNINLVKRKTAAQLKSERVIYLSGTVVDADCRPVPGALIEIWQASASGRYDHTADPSGLPIDKTFDHWGEMRTDDKGRYLFKTIIPGHYPAAPGWVRPPHIHVKVTKLAYRELVTQMYFHPMSYTLPEMQKLVEKLNKEDAILDDVKNPESVTVRFDEVDAGTEFGIINKGVEEKFVAAAGERAGSWEVVIRKVRD